MVIPTDSFPLLMYWMTTEAIRTKSPASNRTYLSIDANADCDAREDIQVALRSPR